MGVTSLSFGGDVRLKVGLFQAEALVLYSAGEVYSFDAYLDAGIVVDVAAFRLSLGAGQSFTNNMGQGNPIQAGFNAKAGAEVMLGHFSVGISYIMALGANADDIPPSGHWASTSSSGCSAAADNRIWRISAAPSGVVAAIASLSKADHREWATAP
jgi:hypothetical protein